MDCRQLRNYRQRLGLTEEEFEQRYNFSFSIREEEEKEAKIAERKRSDQEAQRKIRDDALEDAIKKDLHDQTAQKYRSSRIDKSKNMFLIAGDKSFGRRNEDAMLAEIIECAASDMGSMVIHDPDRSLFNRCSKGLEENGYKVYRIDPTISEGFTDQYNPMEHVRTTSEATLFTDAFGLAVSIVCATKNIQKFRDDIKMDVEMIAAAIMYVMRSPQMNKNMRVVADLLLTGYPAFFPVTWTRLYKAFRSYRKLNGAFSPEFSVMGGNYFTTEGKRAFKNIARSSAERVVAFNFNYGEILAKNNTVKRKELENRKFVIFINIPYDRGAPAYKSEGVYSSVIMGQLMYNYVTRRKEMSGIYKGERVLFILQEAAGLSDDVVEFAVDMVNESIKHELNLQFVTAINSIGVDETSGIFRHKNVSGAKSRLFAVTEITVFFSTNDYINDKQIMDTLVKGCKLTPEEQEEAVRSAVELQSNECMLYAWGMDTFPVVYAD